MGGGYVGSGSLVEVSSVAEVVQDVTLMCLLGFASHCCGGRNDCGGSSFD
jgi:hypothetical protein